MAPVARRKLLFLEPFFGGSHRDFAEGLIACSRHHIDLLTLPSRFWKWRMRGAALHFRKTLDEQASTGGMPLEAYDGIIASGLMSLSDFTALAGPACPPAMVYFHESQLTYPLAPGERFDAHFGFTDITTALCARRVVFNSKTHFDRFFDELPRFLRMMPDSRPLWVAHEIRKKARVMHPGCRFSHGGGLPQPRREGPPVIIWNHRWEFDKDPGGFSDALDAVADQGIDFRLALLGERYQTLPPAYSRILERHGRRILHDGYIPEKRIYQQLLGRGSVVVSTALQENFGISVVEAVRAGCIPLLPRRLSYPEILPGEFHRDFLYDGPGDFVRKLSGLLGEAGEGGKRDALRQRLSCAMAAYAWEHRVGGYDALLSDLAAEGPGKTARRTGKRNSGLDKPGGLG